MNESGCDREYEDLLSVELICHHLKNGNDRVNDLCFRRGCDDADIKLEECTRCEQFQLICYNEHMV